MVTVGRIGTSVAQGGDGFALTDPLIVQRRDNGLSLRGVQSGTHADLLWLAHQLAGLRDVGSEQAVPVTFASAPQLDGFYVVDHAETTAEQGSHGASGAGNWLTWAVDLTETRDRRAPRVESIVTRGPLTPNGFGRSSGAALVGVPPGRTSWYDGLNIGQHADRACADGSSVRVAVQTGVSSAATDIARWHCAASGWYVGSARVETQVGAAWRPTHGRRTDQDPMTMRLGNGLVRVQVAGALIMCEWWTATGWSAAHTFTASDWQSSHGQVSAVSASIVRNAPDEVVVRYACLPAGGDTWGVTDLDISIRRGSRWAVVTTRNAQYAALTWRLAFTSATGCTSTPGGLVRTVADSTGAKPILVSRDATQIDTVNGRISQTASTTGSLVAGIGAVVGAGAGLDSITSQVDEFFCPVVEAVRLVTV